jgi:hypothetical protein
MTRLLPAAWCSPSVFCVMTATSRPAPSIVASAAWPGLGLAASAMLPRSLAAVQ